MCAARSFDLISPLFCCIAQTNFVLRLFLISGASGTCGYATDDEPDSDEDHYEQARASASIRRRALRSRARPQNANSDSRGHGGQPDSDSDSEDEYDDGRKGIAGAFPTRMFTPPEFVHRDLPEGAFLRMVAYEEAFAKIRDRIQVRFVWFVHMEYECEGVRLTLDVWIFFGGLKGYFEGGASGDDGEGREGREGGVRGTGGG